LEFAKSEWNAITIISKRLSLSHSYSIYILI
jgi:hypothetical protein